MSEQLEEMAMIQRKICRSWAGVKLRGRPVPRVERNAFKPRPRLAAAFSHSVILRNSLVIGLALPDAPILTCGLA